MKERLAEHRRGRMMKNRGKGEHGRWTMQQRGNHFLFSISRSFPSSFHLLCMPRRCVNLHWRWRIFYFTHDVIVSIKLICIKFDDSEATTIFKKILFLPKFYFGVLYVCKIHLLAKVKKKVFFNNFLFYPTARTFIRVSKSIWKSLEKSLLKCHVPFTFNISNSLLFIFWSPKKVALLLDPSKRGRLRQQYNFSFNLKNYIIFFLRKTYWSDIPFHVS